MTLSYKNTFQCLLALTVGSALWFGCSSSNDNSNAPGPALAVTPAAPTPTVTVSIAPGAASLGPAAYGENPLEVTAPTNIVWVNADTTPHSATEQNGVFDTGVIQPGASSSPVPFQSPGDFFYGSTVTGDSGMSGEIIVASPSPSPSESPSASPSPSESPSASPSPSESPSPSPSPSPSASPSTAVLHQHPHA